ncbi:MAG TPA: hypothetical protein VMG12_20130 [Polyangiaceae bacterium]|nr:hypothetical protein [Polyangiaceae bacterium]
MAVANVGEGWRASALHLSGALVYGAVWAIARRASPLPTALLSGFDALLMLTCSASFVAMGWQMPLASRPELMAVFGVGQALAARAVFIPSTARRTALISTASALPIAVFTYVYYVTHAPSGHVPSPLAYTYFALILGASIVVMASITSQVIYGLREKVREARELGQYTLLDKIGEGGMGVVYRARHAMLRRATAVKLLLPDPGSPSAAIDRCPQRSKTWCSSASPRKKPTAPQTRTPSPPAWQSCKPASPGPSTTHARGGENADRPSKRAPAPPPRAAPRRPAPAGVPRPSPSICAIDDVR